MELSRFIRQNKPVWTELEQLLEQLRGRKAPIRAEHIDRLADLYRHASTHLAYMQTYFPQEDATRQVNHLVSRAHHTVYQEQFKSKHQIARFFGTVFPSLLAARFRFVVFAALLFLIGAVSGYASVWSNPLNLHILLPPSIANNVDPSRLGEGHDTINNALMSTSIMTNNMKVAMLAFISGITFGLYTAYLLLFNGLLVGALAALFAQAGKTYDFWAYILPHGIIELSIIFIAGGAGLFMGYRMFVPGQQPWKLQLLRSAKESVQLLLGTLPLFAVAGIIEGYVTPSALSLEAKYIFALSTLIIVILYLLYSVKKHQQLTANQSIQGAGS
ncbi:stage II sporulation protein M [Paenibacillus sp. y28]|uniref:stage II sporulation protein M n=1 Tax=Paenibacillus sp. y28 TaxID=3129110 RepID=UPI00301605E8